MRPISCAELTKMGRHIPTPFSLAVLHGQEQLELQIETILRIVPGKRLVGLSHWQGKRVILKLFFLANHWKNNIQRDMKGIELLEKKGLPTPGIVYHTTTMDKQGGVLIIDYLQPGKSLGRQFEETASETEKLEILQSAIELIANCHQSGLWQEDIHLDNFILSANTIHLLDGGGIRGKEGPLDAATSLNNLASFFAQFPARQDFRSTTLLASYRRCRKNLDDVELDNFDERIRIARRQRIASYERKLFRSTTANRFESSSSRYCVYDRSIHSSELDRFIVDPDSFIDQNRLLKDGNSSTVAEVEIDGRLFVLKRYNIKNFWHGLSRLLRPSRARHSWRNALVLEMLGVPTPRPYLFMEERVFGIFKRRAFFLCERVQSRNLGEQLENNESNEIDFDEVLRAFKQLFSVMWDYRISHGDMKSTNFLFVEGQLVVLDLDSMRRNKSGGKFDKKFRKDLARFHKNWIGTKFEPSVVKMVEETLQAIKTLG